MSEASKNSSTLLYRDRDAPVTCDGLVFRTYGYNHPLGSCFCDLEYAPEDLYSSDDPRAIREGRTGRYYKFYFDKGLRFALSRDPPYSVYHNPLSREMVGVGDEQISKVIRPDERLSDLMVAYRDPLIDACVEIIDLVTESSTLSLSDFGVFGSLMHGFHNPRYSDIDLIVFGIEELKKLREVLNELYNREVLMNEFDEWTQEDPPVNWNFLHLSKGDYGFLQRRKGIYSVYDSQSLGRRVKVEFEPVRKWKEIINEYIMTKHIIDLGRIEAVGEVIYDSEGGFMPSIYHINLESIDADVDCGEVKRIVSYIEEFRLQVETGERVLVRGNLERVETDRGAFYQICLSYRERYFDQVLKPL